MNHGLSTFLRGARMGKRPKRYDRSKPLSHPTRRQFALRVLRERDASRAAARAENPESRAHTKACIDQIRNVLWGGPGDA